MLSTLKSLFSQQKKTADTLDPDINGRVFFSEKHQCPKCHVHIEDDELKKQLYVCKKCNYHFRITAQERFALLFDKGSYENISLPADYRNPIDYPQYREKLDRAVEKSKEDEAVSVAKGEILERQIVIASMTFEFLGGSMGTMVGERIIQAMFTAIRQSCPCLLITASGGARMYEGLFSLLQMLRTSHAAALLKQKGIPLFVLLTDPTTGGVTASYAMLGDIILAEPEALIGFAGPRVIEGTIKQKLPEGFQRSEFQLEKGYVDAIVHRANLRKVLAYLLEVHSNRGKGYG